MAKRKVYKPCKIRVAPKKLAGKKEWFAVVETTGARGVRHGKIVTSTKSAADLRKKFRDMDCKGRS